MKKFMKNLILLLALLGICSGKILSATNTQIEEENCLMFTSNQLRTTCLKAVEFVSKQIEKQRLRTDLKTALYGYKSTTTTFTSLSTESLSRSLTFDDYGTQQSTAIEPYCMKSLECEGQKIYTCGSTKPQDVSMAPWYYCDNVDEYRYPYMLTWAECLMSGCRNPDTLEDMEWRQTKNVVHIFDSKPVYTDMYIIRRFSKETAFENCILDVDCVIEPINLPVACTCQLTQFFF